MYAIRSYYDSEYRDGGNGTHQQGMHDTQALRVTAFPAVKEQGVVYADSGCQEQGNQVKQRQPFSP